MRPKRQREDYGKLPGDVHLASAVLGRFQQYAEVVTITCGSHGLKTKEQGHPTCQEDEE